MATGATAEDPITRPAVRLLILDPEDRLLMVRYRDDDRDYSWWGTVGGGVKEGESYEDAARRELREETGLEGVAVGPWVWTREHVFPMYGAWYRQQERFFLVRVPPFTASAAGLDDGEERYFRELRWWTLAELEQTPEELSPRQIGRLLGDLLWDGAPAEPIDAGV